MPGKILIAEDDPDIRELIRLYLENSGYEVISAETGEQAWALFLREDPDLALLDLMLPDLDGIELCRRMKAQGDQPVLIVTCKRDSDDIVEGLESGADDYITKPFDPAVLIARVKANLRKKRPEGMNGAALGALNPQPRHRVWAHSRLVVELDKAELTVDGITVPLYAKERQLLHFLIEHRNQVFSVEQLYERIWGWESGSDPRTVMVHIRNLRKKIEPDPSQPVYIQTVRGFGYRFSAN